MCNHRGWRLPRLENLSVDAAPSRSFPTFQLVRGGWVTVYWRVRILDSGGIAGDPTVGGSTQPIGPGSLNPPSVLCHQLPVLSGLHFECSPATLLDGVQSLLGQKAFGRSRCTSQTTLRHLQDLGLEGSPEFFRIVGTGKFAETFREFPFVLLNNALVSETAYI